MNGLTVMLIALVALACGYFGYARWLEKTWGIDPNRPTPAVENKSGDYAPANKWTVFAHQFTSITGAGPVTGPIIAAMFGWLPALLWMLIGGIFFGAVQDFTALYASVKNGGRSIGMIIEDYIGRTGRALLLAFHAARDCGFLRHGGQHFQRVCQGRLADHAECGGRFDFTPLHVRRGALWPLPEEVPSDSGHSASGRHRAHVPDALGRHRESDLPGQRYVALCGVCVPVCRFGDADVAP